MCVSVYINHNTLPIPLSNSLSQPTILHYARTVYILYIPPTVYIFDELVRMGR